MRLKNLQITGESFPATQALTASSQIAVRAGNAIDLIVVSATSAITLTSTPSIQTSGISDRQQIKIFNGGTFAITLSNGVLSDFAVTIAPSRAVEFVYSSLLNGWIAMAPGSIARQNANAVAITGGSIDNVAIGATTPSSVRATTLTSTSGTDSTSTSTGGVIISGGVGIQKSLSVGNVLRPIGQTVFVPSTTQVLTASSTISANATTVQISAASAITLTSNPQISAGSEGQFLTLYNAGTNAIAINSGSGLSLPASAVIAPGSFINLIFLNGLWRFTSPQFVNTWFEAVFFFQNSFANVSGFQTVQYMRNGNQIFLRGMAQRSTTGLTSGMTVFQLSAGFLPPARIRFPLDSLGNPTSYIDIDSTGIVSYNYSGTPGAAGLIYPSFSGISFWVN